jgi:site-specific DNA-cytosine methylase
MLSQAGEQAGLRDPETARIWNQIFLRLAVEQPRTFVCENARGLMGMKGGAVFDWVLKGFRGAGYVTAHKLGSPPTMGKCFNRTRIFILGLRLDLVARSWWARMDPRTWFQPRADTAFSVVSHILESADTPRAILESRGAVFIGDSRLLTGEATTSPWGVEVYDRNFVRCSPTSVPSPSGDGPAETYVVGLHPASLVIDQAEMNGRTTASTTATDWRQG